MRLVPLQEAAAEYRVGQTTLYRYLKAGELKRYRRGMDKRTFVDRDELTRLVQPREVRGRPRRSQDSGHRR